MVRARGQLEFCDSTAESGQGNPEGGQEGAGEFTREKQQDSLRKVKKGTRVMARSSKYHTKGILVC